MNYSGMKVSQLRALCKEEGIDTAKFVEKSDLIKALEVKCSLKKALASNSQEKTSTTIMGNFDVQTNVKLPRDKDSIPCEVKNCGPARGRERCLALLKKNYQRQDQWYLFIRLGTRWMGQTRMMFVVIVRPPKQMYCYLVDGPNPRNVQSYSGAPSVDQVLACVADLMDACQCKPSKLICCPSTGARFRLSQTLSLAMKLEQALKPESSMEIRVPLCEETPESQPGSLGGTVSIDVENQGALWTKLDEVVSVKVPDMEEALAERPGYDQQQLATELGGYFAAPNLPANRTQAENRKASCALLRELFEASKRFHEACVWEYLSNDEYIHCQDNLTGFSGYLRVVGHTDYSGRGLIIYASKKDLDRITDLNEDSDRLDFYQPNMISMGTVDAVTSLGLPLANNDPDGEVWPSWTRHKGHKSHLVRGTRAYQQNMMRNLDSPAPWKRWAFLARATRALVKFTRDFVSRAPSMNGSLVMAQSPVPFEEGTLILHAGYSNAGILSHEEAEDCMCIGAKGVCNFCWKPASLSTWINEETGELPVSCHDCRIRYCSHRCRDRDKFRHGSCCATKRDDLTRCCVCGLDANMKCSKCRVISYCCKEHQKKDWKEHKKNCPPDVD